MAVSLVVSVYLMFLNSKRTGGRLVTPLSLMRLNALCIQNYFIKGRLGSAWSLQMQMYATGNCKTGNTIFYCSKNNNLTDQMKTLAVLAS